MPDLSRWRTSITRIADSDIAYRGSAVGPLVVGAALDECLWLLLFGTAGTPGQVDTLRRATIAALDHGVAAPAALAARATASTRGPVPLAIAAGMIAFAGPAHGGAAEGAARLLSRILAIDPAGGDEAIRSALTEVLESGNRIPGFGHPYHTTDPRVEPLLAGVETCRRHRDLAVRCAPMAGQLTGRTLHMNADMAVAALVLDAGLQAEDVTLITALGRSYGLAAHAREEQLNEKPFRAPAVASVEFLSGSQTSAERGA